MSGFVKSNSDLVDKIVEKWSKLFQELVEIISNEGQEVKNLLILDFKLVDWGGEEQGREEFVNCYVV